MSSIKDALDCHLKEAMKARDELRVSTIRLARGAIKNREIELIKPLDDKEVILVIRKMIKQRKESIEQFLAGNRCDLAQKEEKEIIILNQYLPKSIDPKALEEKIEAAIQKVGATSIQEMGKVMKVLSAELAGEVDMKEVSQLLREKLSAP